jgi:threonine synthase
MPDIRSIVYPMSDRISYSELLAPLTECLLEQELDLSAARRVAAGCAAIVPELRVLDERFSILRLCGGPTGSFKDFGIAFLSAVFEELLGSSEQIMVVSSVAGTQGTSMAHAFARRKNIICVLLYPRGDIYGLDEAAFMQPGGAGNVIPIRLEGSLDDCNRLITELISDSQWTKRYKTTSANAINPARLLPQAFYYVYAFIKLKKLLKSDLFFSVPSGNFGNLIAGLYAWKFGLPVNGFIAAMNSNNALGDLWRPQTAARREAVQTISPALDVSYPANYERLFSLYNEVPAVMRNMVFPEVITDAQTEQAMEFCWKHYHVLLDPHSAVAFKAALNQAERAEFEGHIVVLATGSAARHPELVQRVTGEAVTVPVHLAALQKKSEPLAQIPCELDMLESAIASVF